MKKCTIHCDACGISAKGTFPIQVPFGTKPIMPEHPSDGGRDTVQIVSALDLCPFHTGQALQEVLNAAPAWLVARILVNYTKYRTEQTNV